MASVAGPMEIAAVTALVAYLAARAAINHWFERKARLLRDLMRKEE